MAAGGDETMLVVCLARALVILVVLSVPLFAVTSFAPTTLDSDVGCLPPSQSGSAWTEERAMTARVLVHPARRNGLMN